MTSVEEAQAQAQQARELLEQKRYEAQEAKTKLELQKTQLEQARSKLPSNLSQQALRQQYSGLQGLRQRQKIEGIKSQYSQAGQQIQSGLSDVQSYQQELSNYETQQLQPYEQNIADYQRDKQAREMAYKYYQKDIFPKFVEDELTKKYLKELYAQRNLTQNAFGDKLEKFQKENPTAILNVDWENLSATASIPTKAPPSLNGFSVGTVGTSTPNGFQNVTLPSGQIAEVNPSTLMTRSSIQISGNVYQQPESNLLFASKDFGTFVNRAVTGYQDIDTFLNTGGGKIKQLETPQPPSSQFSIWNVPEIASKYTTENILPKETVNAINEYFAKRPTQETLLRTAYPTVKTLPAWIFFSPAFSLGASGEGKAASGQKSVSEALSENKFSEITKAINKDSKIRADLLKEKDPIKQLEYLNKIYKKEVKNPTIEDKTRFIEYVNVLYQEGYFKGVPLDYINKINSAPQGQITLDFVNGLPRMNNVGFFTASSSSTFKSPSLTPKPETRGVTYQTFTQKPNTNVLGLNKINQNLRIKNSSLTGLGIALGTSSSLRNQQSTTQLPRTTTQTSTSTRTDTYLRNLLRTNQLTRQTTKQKESTSQIQRSFLRQGKTTGTPLKPKFFLGVENAPRNIGSGGFQVFGKRFGKDFLIGTASTQKEAKTKLKGFLKQTLGRSGYIQKGGMPFFVDLGREFRPSKKTPFKVVQKARFSLGTSAEISEILGARKRSNKKRKRKK